MRRTILLSVAFVFLLGVAFALDGASASIVRRSGIENFFRDKSHGWLRETIKAPGDFLFTIIVAILASVFHRSRWRAGLFLLSVTAMVSGVNWCAKWFAGRLRPFRIDSTFQTLRPFCFRPFRGGLLGGFGPNLSFPSGHTNLAFATAATLTLLFPRWRWPWNALPYAIAICVAIERVVENAHWLSDTVAAVMLGIGGVQIAAMLLARFARRPFGEKFFDELSADPVAAGQT